MVASLRLFVFLLVLIARNGAPHRRSRSCFLLAAVSAGLLSRLLSKVDSRHLFGFCSAPVSPRVLFLRLLLLPFSPLMSW